MLLQRRCAVGCFQLLNPINVYSISLSIADVPFRLRLPRAVRIHSNFEPFLAESDSEGFTVTFSEVDALPLQNGEPVFRNALYTACHLDGEYVRLYHDRDTAESYALVSGDLEEGSIRVRYLAGKRELLSSCRSCVLHIPLEEMLLSWDRLILHASLVTSPFGGILFSGPSGIGKSTQADLWRSLEGSRIINGDRPVLGKRNGRWLAYGSPYAGSSRYYVNESVPVAAIVMLEQGEQCSIRRLGQVDSFRRILSNATVNVWNPDYMRKACDLMMDLTADVPVYHMTCTPDAQAVKTVRMVLRGEGTCENE